MMLLCPSSCDIWQIASTIAGFKLSNFNISDDAFNYQSHTKIILNVRLPNWLYKHQHEIHWYILHVKFYYAIKSQFHVGADVVSFRIHTIGTCIIMLKSWTSRALALRVDTNHIHAWAN